MLHSSVIEEPAGMLEGRTGNTSSFVEEGRERNNKLSLVRGSTS